MLSEGDGPARNFQSGAPMRRTRQYLAPAEGQERASECLSRGAGSVGRWREGRWRVLRWPLCSLPKRLERDVKHGDEEDTDAARRQHADENRRANAAAGNFRSAMCPYQRREADNEGDG